MANLTPAHRVANGRAVSDPAHDAFFVHEAATGAMLSVNRTLPRMYGYTRDEALQVTVEDPIASVGSHTPERGLEWVREAVAGTPPLLEWLEKV